MDKIITGIISSVVILVIEYFIGKNKKEENSVVANVIALFKNLFAKKS